MKLFSFIKNDIKNHKKLYIIITILVILLSFYNNVFAGESSLVTDIPDFEIIADKEGYDLSDYPYYIILYYADNPSVGYDYIGYFSKSPFTCCSNPNNATTWKIESNSSDTLRIDATSIKDYSIKGVTNWYAVRPNITYFMYANHNIKNTDNDTVFFYSTPLHMGVLPLIGTSTTTQQVYNKMTEQLAYLIPLVVGLVISYLALRKALGILAHFLRKA